MLPCRFQKGRFGGMAAIGELRSCQSVRTCMTPTCTYAPTQDAGPLRLKNDLFSWLTFLGFAAFSSVISFEPQKPKNLLQLAPGCS